MQHRCCRNNHYDTCNMICYKLWIHITWIHITYIVLWKWKISLMYSKYSWRKKNFIVKFGINGTETVVYLWNSRLLRVSWYQTHNPVWYEMEEPRGINHAVSTACHSGRHGKTCVTVFNSETEHVRSTTWWYGIYQMCSRPGQTTTRTAETDRQKFSPCKLTYFRNCILLRNCKSKRNRAARIIIITTT